MSKNGVFQIVEKILANNGIFKVHIITEPLFLRIKGNIATLIVEGEEAEGEGEGEEREGGGRKERVRGRGRGKERRKERGR